ncbi:MAG: helix-hairpin-helix domain-containing protein [Burkholderiales bacterium]|nr:helix-hairpin-helix domain-containing protein [Burkholderiales bacterium]
MKIFSKSMLLLAAAIIFPMAAFAGPVNINTADAATISAELQGVGLTKAQAIVDYRKAHGPFKSYEDLTLVKGIGARTVEINRANILFKSAEMKK